MYWSPQLLGRSLQKARNFTASVTRMQDLASKFSKNFPGVTLPNPHNGGATPSRIQHPAQPLTGHGAQAPRCWDPNLCPPQLFSGGCAPDLYVAYVCLSVCLSVSCLSYFLFLFNFRAWTSCLIQIMHTYIYGSKS